jgi:chitinase
LFDPVWNRGWSTTISSFTHAFLYSGGSMSDLGTLGGARSGADGINNSGQVTGFADLSNGTTHAFLYSGGSMSDLGTLGGTGSEGLGINDLGHVRAIPTPQATSPSMRFCILTAA